MATELIDAIHRNRAIAQGVAGMLRSRASALNELGMCPGLADDLCDVADRIEATAKDVSDAFGKQMNDDLRHSEEMAGNLLKAALIGVMSPAKSMKG